MSDITNGPGRHYILLEVETRKGVAGLADKVAGRAWTLEGVVKTQALALDNHDAFLLAMDEVVARHGVARDKQLVRPVFYGKPQEPNAVVRLTPAQVAQMEEACAASDRLTLPVRGEVQA